MIRCVGAALRGDGNPPEVPVIRTVLRAYIKRWASPVCKCALPTSEDLYLDSEKGMMVLLGALRPCSLASSIEDSTSRPSELRKADVGSRTRTGCVDGTPAVPSRSSDGS